MDWPLALNIEVDGAPYGTRTRVTAVKGRCPGPLDEGRDESAKALHKGRRHIEAFAGTGKQAVRPAAGHHFPILAMEVQGSFGGSGSPFCNSSIECLSGERTNAMEPSRGGRLMMTPAFISLSQSA